ncbi:CPBP family intramembrane glutamic endopeptidase [Lutibacter sp.]
MDKKKFPHTVLQSLGVVLFIFIYTIPLVFLERKLFKNDDSHNNAVFIIFLIASIATILTVLYINFKKHIKIEFNVNLNSFHFLALTIFTLILFQIAFGKPFNFIVNSLMYPNKNVDNPFQLIGLTIGALFIAPIVEEIIFRGMILKGLLTNYSPRKAIIISTLIFGFMHPHPAQFLGALIIGFYLNWVYYKTKSLGNTILLHFVANTSGLILSYLTYKFGGEGVANIYGDWSTYIILGSMVLMSVLLAKLFTYVKAN